MIRDNYGLMVIDTHTHTALRCAHMRKKSMSKEEFFTLGWSAVCSFLTSRASYTFVCHVHRVEMNRRWFFAVQAPVYDHISPRPAGTARSRQRFAPQYRGASRASAGMTMMMIDSTMKHCLSLALHLSCCYCCCSFHSCCCYYNFDHSWTHHSLLISDE